MILLRRVTAKKRRFACQRRNESHGICVISTTADTQPRRLPVIWTETGASHRACGPTSEVSSADSPTNHVEANAKLHNRAATPRMLQCCSASELASFQRLLLTRATHHSHVQHHEQAHPSHRWNQQNPQQVARTARQAALAIHSMVCPFTSSSGAHIKYWHYTTQASSHLLPTGTLGVMI